MPLISDTNQKKLEKLNINIKTKYIYMKYTLNNIQTFFNKNPVN